VVCLVSCDAGPRFLAKGRGFKSFEPPHTWRLVEDDPVEKELRAAKQRIALLEAQHPKIRLHFVGDADHTTIMVPQPLPETHEQYAICLENVRDGLPPYTEPEPHPAFEAIHVLQSLDFNRPQVMDYEIEAFDKERESYFAEIEQLIPTLVRGHNSADLHLAIGELLRITNDGTAPGEYVELVLFAPDGIAWATEVPPFVAPERPKPPVPRSHLERARGPRISPERVRPWAEMAAERDRPPRWVLSDGSQRAVLRLDKVKHQQTNTSPKLYAVMPSYEGMASFSVRYKVHADNLPAPLDGELHLKIEKATHPRRHVLLGGTRCGALGTAFVTKL
jgi:hypothetical protein